MDKTLTGRIKETTLDEIIKIRVPVEKIKEDMVIGRINGDTKIEGYGVHNRATIFSMISEDSEKSYNISGTHIDKLLNGTVAALIPSAAKRWIDGYATFDNEGHIEYFFYRG